MNNSVNKNLWGGRFTKELSETTNSFNSSIAFDQRLYKEDIAGSIVHATMLQSSGIITQDDLDSIVAGLSDILHQLESGQLKVDSSAEDIHMFVEATLTQMIGDVGKKLHTARSRNDQVAVDAKLYLRGETKAIMAQLVALSQVLIDSADTYRQTLMPGYTHLQRAQPISFGYHLMAYVQMFFRDLARLGDALKRMNEGCPLGSGALAGTTYPIDRQYTATALGFDSPSLNSMDGVSDRDYMLELMSDLSIVMLHLSRFCEEIILWCSWEFQFITLDDAFSTGSSIMPQKKNPDIAELVRGKTGRVYGNLFALLTVMKGLPLAYNKDMQEDKEAVFDSVDTVKECLSAFTPMIATIKVNQHRMKSAAAEGFINATDCADYLVGKGLPFRDAYTITGGLVAYCIGQAKTLETLSLEEYNAASPLFEADVFAAIKLENCLNKRASYGGPASMDIQLEVSRKMLSDWQDKTKEEAR